MHAEVLRNKIQHLQLSNFLSNDSGKIKQMSKNKKKNLKIKSIHLYQYKRRENKSETMVTIDTLRQKMCFLQPFFNFPVFETFS